MPMTDDIDIEAATDVLTEAAETAESTLNDPTVRWDSGLGGACSRSYWEKRAAGMRLGLTALDALARGPELLERIAALKVMQATSDAALAEALTARCDAETKVDWWRGKADRLAELEARERRVREACEDVHRQCAQAQYDPEVMSVAGFADDVLAILDGKVTP